MCHKERHGHIYGHHQRRKSSYQPHNHQQRGAHLSKDHQRQASRMADMKWVGKVSGKLAEIPEFADAMVDEHRKSNPETQNQQRQTYMERIVCRCKESLKHTGLYQLGILTRYSFDSVVI